MVNRASRSVTLVVLAWCGCSAAAGCVAERVEPAPEVERVSQALLLSPELRLHPRTPVSARGRGVRVAGGDGLFLAAWSTSGGSGDLGYPVAARIRAHDLAVLDPIGIRLNAPGAPCAEAWPYEVVSVTHANGTFLVLLSNSGGGVCLVRVGPDGLATRPVAIENSSGHAIDGNGLVASWSRHGETWPWRYRLSTVRLATSGTPLGAPLELEDQSGEDNTPFWTPQVAFTSGRYLIAVQSGQVGQEWVGFTRAHVVDAASGERVGDVIPLDLRAAEQSTPVASFDGEQHLVVWTEQQGPIPEVRAARLRDADGALLDPRGFLVGPASAGRPIRVASNGRTHLVVWREADHSLRAARVRGRDSVVLDTPPLILPANVHYDGSGRVAPPYGGLGNFAVASDGQDYLLAWSYTGYYTGGGLRALRVAADGTWQPGGVQTVREAGTFYVPPRPHLTFAGSQYLLAWAEPTASADRTVLARLGNDGAPIAPEWQVPGSLSALVPMGGVVAAIGPSGGENRVRRIRLSDGMLLDEPALSITSLPGSGNEYHFASAFDGRHLLSAWTGPSQPGALLLSRMTPEGTVPEPEGWQLAGDPEWRTHSPALSVGKDGRVLAAYVRIDRNEGLGAPRVHFRWIEGPTSTIDASSPRFDAAPDTTPPDAEAFDAPLPADRSPPADVPLTSDAGTPAPDASLPLDASPSPLDARLDPDAPRSPDARWIVGVRGGGCSCRLGNDRSAAPSAWVAALLLLLASRSRRRRRP